MSSLIGLTECALATFNLFSEFVTFAIALLRPIQIKYCVWRRKFCIYPQCICSNCATPSANSLCKFFFCESLKFAAKLAMVDIFRSKYIKWSLWQKMHLLLVMVTYTVYRLKGCCVWMSTVLEKETLFWPSRIWQQCVIKSVNWFKVDKSVPDNETCHSRNVTVANLGLKTCTSKSSHCDVERLRAVSACIIIYVPHRSVRDSAQFARVLYVWQIHDRLYVCLNNNALVIVSLLQQTPSYGVIRVRYF